MSLSNEIKEYGLDLGYSAVGITDAGGFPDYISELKTRSSMYDWYIASAFNPLAGAEPRNVMPSAKSIIVTVWDGYRESFPEKLLGKVGRIYLSRTYLAPRNRINGARRQLMKEFLEQKGCQVAQRLVVPERSAAARAGVTHYGKNTFAFLKNSHSFIIVTTFVVDKELEYDKPTMLVTCPPRCTVCIDACPTKALYQPLKMNPKRCIAFNTFMSQDGNPAGITSYIPQDIREKMGTWIHGCDICQEVCPRNQKRLKTKLPSNEFLEMLAQDFELTKLLNITDEFYLNRVQPIMYNYIKEKKYFQRNAAIALGNTGDPAFLPDLKQALHSPEPLVRGYSAWAIGRIGGIKGKQALEIHIASETDDFAKKEIETALKMS